ncbi:MAG TPA: PDZ domain-containing protein [Verrucomicrobiae bacterium]|nr:PDZ domain-containing protein [Verrucomicrobiae bacterium]
MKTILTLSLAAACFGLGGSAVVAGSFQTNGASSGPINARMLRLPDVSATQIVFVYAGDIWVVPKSGGYAQRLSSPKGEESFPRFSPDGSRIAFSGNYDGNTDIYVVSAQGGLPRRITYHGEPDRMLDWYPDGESILFASMRTSEKERFNKLYKVSVDVSASGEGALPVKLPVPYGEFGMISPDGKTLAYIPISVDFATWKRYRGGTNPDIWLFDLEKLSAKNITHNDAADTQPMWHGSILYFLSDRDKNKRANIWAYDTKKDKVRQITSFDEFDIHFPSIGPEDIVFENGGRLYLLDLATEKHHEVEIKVVTDRATLKPRIEDVSKLVRRGAVSPSGKRAVFEARGEVFTVPAEHGIVRNLTRSSGVAERYPAWSPDGKTIAYFSDRTGEYELTLRPASGSGAETTVTKLGPGYRYTPVWSPDSKKIVFIDQAMKIHLHDVEKQETTQIDKQMWTTHGRLSGFRFNWSSDSRWLTYAKDQDNGYSAIMIYDTKDGQKHQVTTGFYDDDDPVFDRDGKYLFYQSGRTMDAIYSDIDHTWVYPNTVNLVAISLRKDVPSLLAPRNDEEGDKDKKKDKESDSSSKKDEKKRDDAGDDKKKEDGEEVAKKEKPPKPVEIDFDNFESRLVVLPPKPGYYTDVASVSGKLIYRRLPRAGALPDEKSPVKYYDFEKREEKTIIEDADQATLADKGEKLLVRKKDDYAIIDVKEGQKMEKKLPTSGFEALIDPVAEWKQLFTEAWRLERDYFYDPGMHGVDWNAMRQRYGALMDDAVTRWDVNYVLGELIGELNSSHTYRGGGDTEKAEDRGVGYLGVDFAFENGAYRIKKIVEAATWDDVRSPLRQPGVDVKEGDYLLAVNGLPLDVTLEPWAAFQGLADKPVMITVNDKATSEGARDVLVQTLARESRLRHLAWIESNRRKVDELSKGKIGYIFVPDTARSGQSELVRQFRAQISKAGLIIDERFNNGGQLPDRFVELLGRKRVNYIGNRDGKNVPWPLVAHDGPKAMLINAWAGSGGDCFPYYFQQAKLGPLIGTRTWGGLIGMSGAPSLIDGGSVTVPTMGLYSTKSEWLIEGHGVDPDIKVIDDPALMAKGADPQLERAVDEVIKALKKETPVEVGKPKYPLKASVGE